MNTLLLLGAGFSRNWAAGWQIIVDYLLAAPEVQADSPLKDLIWQHAKVGFESALEQLQQQATDNPESTAVQRRLVSFQSALERMFRELNAVFFEDPDFEFNHQIGSHRARVPRALRCHLYSKQDCSSSIITSITSMSRWSRRGAGMRCSSRECVVSR